MRGWLCVDAWMVVRGCVDGCACDAAVQGGVHLAPQDFHKAMEKDNTVSVNFYIDFTALRVLAHPLKYIVRPLKCIVRPRK
jgi:hypothetical protein